MCFGCVHLSLQLAVSKYSDRVAKNWDVAMGLLIEQPHKLEEYIVLKLEMSTFEKRFARATVSTEKLELQTRWERYCAMEPVYEKARKKANRSRHRRK